MNRVDAVVERLDRLWSFSDLAFDRDGNSVLATVTPASHAPRESYQSRIWRFSLEGDATRLTAGPGADALPRVSPAGGRIAFASDRDERGKMALHLLDGGVTSKLGDVAGTIEEIRWTADGKALVVLAADRGLDSAATAGAQRLAWGREEDPQVTSPAHGKRRLLRVTVDDGATTEVGPTDHSVWEFDLLGADAAIVIASTDASERGWYHAGLVRVDFHTRTAEVLHRSQWQLQGPAVDPSGRRVAFLEAWSSDRGLVCGEIRVLDLATGAVDTIAGLSDVTSIAWRDETTLWFGGWSDLGARYGLVGLDGRLLWQRREDATIGASSFNAGITPAPDNQGFAAIRQTGGAPQEILFKANAEADWRPLSRLNADVFADFPDYPDVRRIDWQGADGTALAALVLVPRDRRDGPLPAIVDIHGGPSWATHHAFDPGGALPLAAAGYVVFLPNYRGNVGWGPEFGRLNIGDPGGAEFADILAGLDACIAAGLVDGERVGVTGASYGGFMTAWAVATSRRFKAAVMVSGISDQASSHYSCNHDFSAFILGGSPADERILKLAIERSPLHRLAGATTPTLIIHGEGDRCTPLGQAQELYAGLCEQGVTTELLVYPREGHGLREREHRRDAWRRAIAWFDRFLRPGR